MSLIVSVVLVERVIQVTVNPIELGHVPQKVGHLGVIIWCVVVSGSDGVECLVGVRMHNCITDVVVALLPKILW